MDVLGVRNVVLFEIRTMVSIILTSDVGGPSYKPLTGSNLVERSSMDMDLEKIGRKSSSKNVQIRTRIWFALIELDLTSSKNITFWSWDLGKGLKSLWRETKSLWREAKMPIFGGPKKWPGWRYMGLTRCFSDLIFSVDVEKVQDEAIRTKIRK